MSQDTMLNTYDNETTPAMKNYRDLSVQTSAGSSCWNKRTRLEKRLLALVCITIIATIVCAIVLIVQTSQGSQEEVCSTEKCIVSASNLLQSMDQRKNPCEDFYGYACGNWKQRHVMPDTFNIYSWSHENTLLIQRDVRDFLSRNQTGEPSTWTRAKKLYRSCLDTARLDSLKLEPVFKILEMIGLQRMPPLPDNTSASKSSLNWLAVAARAKKLLSIDLLVGFAAQPFFEPDKISIILGPAKEATFFPEFYNTKGERENIRASMTEGNEESGSGMDRTKIDDFVNYRADVLSYVYNKSIDEIKIPAVSISLLEIRILQGLISSSQESQIDEFEALANFINGTQNLTKIETEPSVHVSIDTLQLFTNSIRHNGSNGANWTEYFSILFEGVDGVKISRNTTIIISHTGYIKNLLEIMFNAKRDQVELLLWWKVMKAAAGHTTEQLRQISEKYSKLERGIEATPSRSQVCTAILTRAMGMAVISFSANSGFLATTKKAIDDMHVNIKDALTSIVKSSTWLDSESKNSIIKKVDDIVINPAYPKWVMDKDKLEEYYKGVEIHEGEFLLGAVNIAKWRMKKLLTSFATGLLGDEYYINPAIINAYYNIFRQSITFLAGYLKFPLYDLGHDALNYGTTAFVMAHELHHAFDGKGIFFNKGKLGLWWNEKFVLEFIKRRQCFIQRFSEYGWDNLKVNGNLTVDENLADNGGLRTSLLAYQNILKKKGSEQKLPGLTNYTSEQLFFLSFANFFCSDTTEKGKQISLQDVHTPLMFRLIASVKNSEEFSRIWNCPKEKDPNPKDKKCTLW